MCGDKIIEIKNLSKYYGRETNPVLDRISFTIKSGSISVITGASGSGKTTILKILYGLTGYDEGSCMIRKKQLRDMSQKELVTFRSRWIGYLPQDFCLIEDWTVRDNMSLPLLLRSSHSLDECRSEVDNMLRQLNLRPIDFTNKKISQLSGGERQRVALGRALITKPSLLLADELTSALDYQMKTHIMELLLSLRDASVTILFTTHDTELLKHCDTIIHMRHGKAILQ